MHYIGNRNHASTGTFQQKYQRFQPLFVKVQQIFCREDVMLCGELMVMILNIHLVMKSLIFV